MHVIYSGPSAQLAVVNFDTAETIAVVTRAEAFTVDNAVGQALIDSNSVWFAEEEI